MEEAQLLAIATALQDIWLEEQKALGFHLPAKCPNYEHSPQDDDTMAEMIHCKHCQSLLLPYAELDNYSRAKLDSKAARLLAALQKNGFSITRG